MNSLRSVIRDVAQLILDDRVIPVCGAGFSLNAAKAYQPPSWSGLVGTCLDDSRTKQRLVRAGRLDDVRFLSDECNDHLTALSLITALAPWARSACLRNVEAVTSKATIRDLGVHQKFWGIDWPLVVTTNYDTFLEVSNPHCKVLDHSLPDLTRRLQDEARLRDSNVVIHLHGSFASTGGGEPLVTWTDYLEAYRWNNPTEIADLVRHMDATSKLPGHARPRYRSILDEHLRSAAGANRDRLPGRVVATIDRLLADKICLFLGFSFYDPIWRLILHRLNVVGATSVHYMIAPPPVPRHLKKNVRRVPIVGYTDIPLALELLSAEVGKLRRHEDSGERRSRDQNYRHLVHFYPEFARPVPEGFIAQGRDESGAKSFVPFTELWCNSARLAPDRAICVSSVAPTEFKVASFLSSLREKYWQFRKAIQEGKRDGGDLVNEAKIRIRNVRTSPRGILELDVQRAEYKDFLVTNHLAANMDSTERGKIQDAGLVRQLDRAFITEEGFDPRERLCPDANSIALSPRALCSNHLGVSILVIADLPEGNTTTPALLCPPTRGQVSSPKDLVMTASGSADWPLQVTARTVDDLMSPAMVRRRPKQLFLADQVWREFSEESVQDPAEEQRLSRLPLGRRFRARFRIARRKRQRLIYRAALINLCQNIDRGGKPELFYVASTRLDGFRFVTEELNYNWELAPIHSTEIVADVETARGQRRMMCLRSPLDRNLRIVANAEPAFRQLLSVILDNRFNPVLRAHLVAVMRWCLLLDRIRISTLLRKLGQDRLSYLVGMT